MGTDSERAMAANANIINNQPEDIDQLQEMIRASQRHTARNVLLVAIALIVAVALFTCAWSFAGISSVQSEEQGALSIRQMVLSTSMQCFAIEGAYPPSLSYLQENYGLVVNTDDYVITYESFASNILPSVTVRVR